MCGRYNIIPNAQAWVDTFEISVGVEVLDGLTSRFNVAPSQLVPAVRLEDEGRALRLLRWGLIPAWAKGKDFGYKCINARAETVAEKPAFRSAFKTRRCLIPASGFYEWRQEAAGKQPYCIRLAGGEPFAMAGLWEHWEGDGQVIESCSIIVTAANELMSTLHDRMPVILSPDDYGQWLDPAEQDRERLKGLLQPYPGRLDLYPVSKRVNSPRNDDPDCVASIAGHGEAPPDAPARKPLELTPEEIEALRRDKQQASKRVKELIEADKKKAKK